MFMIWINVEDEIKSILIQFFILYPDDHHKDLLHLNLHKFKITNTILFSALVWHVGMYFEVAYNKYFEAAHNQYPYSSQYLCTVDCSYLVMLFYDKYRSYQHLTTSTTYSDFCLLSSHATIVAIIFILVFTLTYFVSTYTPSRTIVICSAGGRHPGNRDGTRNHGTGDAAQNNTCPWCEQW